MSAVLDRSIVRHVAIAIVAGVALFVLTSALDPYGDLQVATMGYYFVAVAGLTVLTGQNGQISLGHGALMAIGAYATVKLDQALSLPLAALLVLAAVVTAAAGLLAGAAAARLRGPYLAGATLTLAVGLPALASRFSGFLGGSNGLSVSPPTPPLALGETFPLERWQAWIACVAALVTYVLLANLLRSGHGRAMRAVRDDEIAAELAGFHVARTQIATFAVSAACAGLAGGLLVVVTSLAAPGAFTLTLSVALLTGAILGGLGSLTGAVWGSAALVLIPNWSDDASKALSLSDNVQANLALALYGVVLIVVVLVAPHGIQGVARRLAAPALRAKDQRERGRVPREEGA